MTALAAAAGGLVDQIVGEPPLRWHPVARYGATMQRVEQTIYADRRSNGIAFTAIGVGLGTGIGLALRRTVGPTLATVVATAVSAAGRMLDDEAITMAALLHSGDLGTARERVRSLVGRSTADLDQNEISRAVIESVAENCVDAVTSSMFWATIGGAPAVLAHRAVNTLDAMVGHHDERYERFGWASARLDDVANYLPARLTAIAAALVRPTRARAIATVVRRDAPRHPSPNGGIVEAAFAAALGVQLGGINRYDDDIEDRGTLGDGHPPTVDAIDAAVRLRRHTTAATSALLVVGSALAQRVIRRSR
ncbi:MAG: adenosylcobinamide-phosphate synthase CbiB [Ilumatobacteraceae bacterium]